MATRTVSRDGHAAFAETRRTVVPTYMRVMLDSSVERALLSRLNTSSTSGRQFADAGEGRPADPGVQFEPVGDSQRETGTGCVARNSRSASCI